MFTPGDTFPYIGLRPFSEDDSLYFKGRDEQILQLTALLEANKFLMVTGASGDGKSSLVYAGLVPNARAGFFRAKYPNWVVADFRPERTPLHNLSRTISKNLRIGDEQSVEIELRRGFSSLVELYRTSSLFVDEQGDAWKRLNVEERELEQRRAANLLIVTDQFEEFFTNPENYYRNSPSADSQLVINLLLETVRIANEKNLPIYIVCTMRSDYIGQCAAFRGLPEFIGFSQFFVPRLKRKEMVQVVKEPAFLHGDRIADRLVERVVYDLGEGIDQLPVLEHAMNEVWIQAGFGKEELDLIHYAMAGGMSSHELPSEDRQRFQSWFEGLSSRFQEAYQHPGLSQIIDTHANKLYLSAADHYNQKHDRKITSADAQSIIRVAFTCLTKMDEGRAVRNRMTLQEITDILARPELSCEVVGGVLNIFREPGNTFLRPYITDEPESHVLTPESVLDITHESLIRNWELLLSWAKVEYDHLSVYNDFKKQLDRWLKSNKSKGFLLPIGPLTFFENWHSKLNPNKYWVNRYLDPGLDRDARLKEAQQIIDDTQDFLKRSASKVRVTRLVVKYGAARIAAVIGSLLVVALCGFYYRDAQQKENDNVVRRILAQGKTYIPDPRFESDRRATFLMLSELMEPGSFKRAIVKLETSKQFDIIREVYKEFVLKGGNPELRRNCLYLGDSLVMSSPIRQNDPAFLMERLRALNILIAASSHYLYYFQDQRMEAVMKNALGQSKEIILVAFNQNFNLRALDVPALDDAIENTLNFGVLTKEDIQQLTLTISPFEAASGKAVFDRYFPKGSLISYSGTAANVAVLGASGTQFNHNAGYQQLAYLYGALGKVDRVNRCLDSLYRYHPNYSSLRDNVLNIATYFFKGGYTRECDELLAHYAEVKKGSKKELYELWLNNSGYLDRHLVWKLLGSNHNANIELLDWKMVNGLFDQYGKVIVSTYPDPNERNFNLALYLKHRGILLSKIDADKGGRYQFDPDSLFKASLEFYRKVPASYLNTAVDVYNEDFVQQAQMLQRRKRSDLFLYPDHFQKTMNTRDRPSRYFSDKFLSYLLRSREFSLLYREANDLELIKAWMFEYDRYNRPDFQSRLIKNYTPLSESMLQKVDSVFTSNPLAARLNKNQLRLVLLNRYMDTGDDAKIEEVFRKLEPEKINENLREGSDREQRIFSHHLGRLIEYLASKGRKEEAFRLIRSYPEPSNLVKAYACAPLLMLRNGTGPGDQAYEYLDSAVTGFDRMGEALTFTTGNDPRIVMVLALSLVGGKEMNDLARFYVGKISLGEQSAAMQSLILGTTLSGNYHQAVISIPEIVLGERLFYFNLILTTEALKMQNDKEWQAFLDGYQLYHIWDLIYIVPEFI